MRYFFINTFCTKGSTGRIVCETARKLIREGNECMIAYGRDTNVSKDIKTYKIGTKLDIAVHGIMTRLFDRHGFCSKKATRQLLEVIKDYKPDVIWLHNLHGYYLNIEILFSFIKTMDYKVKWTLHDCWSFTGHCPHFSFVDCNKWMEQCHDCPQLRRYPSCIGWSKTKGNFLRKKKAFTGIKDMELIVPSYWLEGLVKKSFLKDYQVTVQYNTVDNKVFYPIESNIREKYNLTDKIIVLGVAMDWTKYKGLSEYYYLAEKLSDNYKVVLIGLSKRQLSKVPDSVLGLPKTRNIDDLVKWYSTADVLVSASREETFGMTILEAHSCGTPSIVYKNTACEEVAQLCGNGVAVEWGAENIYKEIVNMNLGKTEVSTL